MKRKDWHATQQTVDPERLVFLDETGLKTDLTRRCGWAEGGERLVEAVPSGRWSTNTLVHAIALDGTRAAMMLDGLINGESFTGFCEWLLVPALHPIMDNLSSHKASCVAEAIEAVGAEVWYLPPNSPDINPIELMWSKVKNLLRSFAARTKRTLITAIGKALNAVTPEDAQGWFSHDGYGTCKC